MVSRRDQRYTFRALCCGAKQVFVAGDFNDWSTTAHPMHRVGHDLWQLSIRLAPGEYRFRYVTEDNRWITDFQASGVVHNDYGEWDSLLRVPDEQIEPRSPRHTPGGGAERSMKGFTANA